MTDPVIAADGVSTSPFHPKCAALSYALLEIFDEFSLCVSTGLSIYFFIYWYDSGPLGTEAEAHSYAR